MDEDRRLVSSWPDRSRTLLLLATMATPAETLMLDFANDKGQNCLLPVECPHDANSLSNTLASFRSRVSKPSANQL
jgi:hypothetical protein